MSNILKLITIILLFGNSFCYKFLQAPKNLDYNIINMYSGNISKAVIDALKGIPVSHLNIVYENHTDSNFINTFQKYLQYEEIQTRLFNISSTNVQDQFFSFLQEILQQYDYAFCIFFGSHRLFEHILIELKENNIIHRNLLMIFYWGSKPFTRYFIRSLHESISTIVITNPRNDTFYYNQAISHRQHHLSLVNWWSESAGLFRRPTLPKAKEVYADFKGKIFYIPAVHKPPWYFVKITNESIEIQGGRDDKLLTVIAKALNFRYEYIDPVEQSLVTGITNNTFQSALNLIWKREADFFMGDITLTLERRSLVEFSFLTLADSGAFITHSPSRLNEALALVRPFHWKVWPPITLLVIFSGPFLYGLIALPDRWRHKSNIKSHKELFFNCVWFTLCLYLKQTRIALEIKSMLNYYSALRLKPLLYVCNTISFFYNFIAKVGKDPSKSDKSRLFIITISIAATYFIGNMYSANLTSMLARPGREKPIENLAQLELAMQTREYKLYVEEHSSYYDLLQNGTGIYGRLWNLMKHQKEFLIDSVENGAKMIKQDSTVAVIAGRETLFFDVQRFGTDIDGTVYGANNFHLSEKLNTAYSAIAMQSGCPYLENMNRVLMGVFEAGILTKMTEDEYELLGKSQIDIIEDATINIEPGKSAEQADAEQNAHKAKPADDNEGIRPISIKMVQGAFIVVLMGHCGAGLVLLLEIYWFTYSLKNPNKTLISFSWVKKIRFKVHVVKKRLVMWTKRKYNRVKEEVFFAFLDYVD